VKRVNAEAVGAAASVLASGGSVAAAAAAGGVSRRTISRWCARGRLELTPFARLAAEADRAPPPQAEPLGEAEIVELLEREARRGSVRACEVLLRRTLARRPSVSPELDPFAEVDELARRRREALGR
jgi:transposase